MKQGAARRAFRWAFLPGFLGGAVGAVLLTKAIGRSTISTAALGFIELPVVAFLWAVPCAAMGFCLVYLVLARRMGRPLSSFPMLLAGLALLALVATSATYVVSNLVRGWEVGRIAAMSQGELEGVLTSRYFGTNPFVLAAVAQSPRASPAILRAIAIRKDPELHEKLFSIFDVMGSNTHGLAVMRLVARNPNVDAETLDILAQSEDGYVLYDVAINPKLSEQTLGRIHEKTNPILEWFLSRDPKTPTVVLARLSQNPDASVRSNVAAHFNTSPTDLARLGRDMQSSVRKAVASNPHAPLDVREALRNDPDPSVGAAVPTR